MNEEKDEVSGHDEESPAEPNKKAPKGHAKEIDGKHYWCEPKRENGIYDPAAGGTHIIGGVEHWCIPYEVAFPGRRYNQGGRIDPSDTD
ncbi:hypothetical protein Enr10x_52430 [Gimesia panareensis]|uniref:Uncharacterized protein n=1 Tax=Gimesia panareensis TaxID=2527978 RepID=A0A517QE22_9PLAN|nr:hypothetical protein [Gimesia panareensis]QDT29886.1 hypothetical protein Enr10x_52430 [Gimesia panareensis]